LDFYFYFVCCFPIRYDAEWLDSKHPGRRDDVSPSRGLPSMTGCCNRRACSLSRFTRAAEIASLPAHARWQRGCFYHISLHNTNEKGVDVVCRSLCLDDATSKDVPEPGMRMPPLATWGAMPPIKAQSVREWGWVGGVAASTYIPRLVHTGIVTYILTWSLAVLRRACVSQQWIIAGLVAAE
jgi:hypothetical protein